jgi:hypothetical protein
MSWSDGVLQVVGNGSPLPPSGYTSLGTVTITQSYTSMLNAFTTNAGLVSLNGWENGRKLLPTHPANHTLIRHRGRRF